MRYLIPIGCVSESSVAVSQARPKSLQPEPTSASPKGEEGDSSSPSSVKMKGSFVLLSLPKPNISAGLQRLAKSFKSLSQLFIYRKEEEIIGEGEMEIGFPTDVKHVAHIGWDGTDSVTNTMKSWDRAHPELLPLPSSVSMRQFQLAMAAQADEAMAKLPPLGSHEQH